jgi:two-component system, NarL family, response regulator DevR
VVVRILVADPQPFFCEALAAALDEDERLQVVGWTHDAAEAVRLMASLRPDVLLSDLGLASGPSSGLLDRNATGASVIVLTRGHEGDALLSVAEAGAAGCIGHDTGVGTLSSLISDAADGRFIVDPDRLGAMLRRASASRREQVRGPDLARLTSREREILDLLTEGLDNPAIAEHLHLSANTVRTHVGNVLRKLGVRSRAEAVKVALRAGTGEAPVSVLRIEGPSLGET